MAWRWKDPEGCAGVGVTSPEEARELAVNYASGKPVDDADLRAVLWRSLERAGWSVESHEP